MIEVMSLVNVYELDDKRDFPIGENPEIWVESHGIYSDRVVLEIDGHKYTVLAKDIIAAISNAQNTARF